MAKFLMTGAAGFIGSNFSDSLLAQGHQVVGFDNLETGNDFFLREAKRSTSFSFVKGDIREFHEIAAVAREVKADWLIHFAANADVRRGLERPRRDLDYNTTGTWNVAEAARLAGTKNLLFSSTGSVYGEPSVFPTPETCPFPEQTSLYGASKAAGESILSAYAHGYGLNVCIFRFVSILGPRYTHGHVFDFLKKLRIDPTHLEILGNGLQLKSYLHISDLLAGLNSVIASQPQNLSILNIGHDQAMTVNESVTYICDELKVKPELHYTGGTRGWIGDSPRIQLACDRMRKFGWAPTKSIEFSVRDTVRYLMAHPELLEASPEKVEQGAGV